MKKKTSRKEVHPRANSLYTQVLYRYLYYATDRALPLRHTYDAETGKENEFRRLGLERPSQV